MLPAGHDQKQHAVGLLMLLLHHNKFIQEVQQDNTVHL